MTLAAVHRPRRVAPSRDFVDRVRAFNAGRDPALLQLKFAKLADNAFSFFRGTAHLFHEDFPAELKDGPATWASGDLHLENFGGYRGANGLAYYDVNDFDEAVLASPLLDPARYLVSIFLGTQRSEALILAREFIEAYRAALLQGSPGWIERATARGVVRDHLMQVRRRRRRSLLRRHIELTTAGWRIVPEKGHLFAAPRHERDLVQSALRSSYPDARCIHVMRRIMGTGSLGVGRWLVLVRHRSTKQLDLLDVKESLHSSAEPFAPVPQPHWRTQAERVIAIQRRMQSSPPRLQAIGTVRQSMVMRPMQLREDKLQFEHIAPRRLRRLVHSTGQIAAWNQLRSTGRCGSATADNLMAWARRRDWQGAALVFARRFRDQVVSDWKEFQRAYRGPTLEEPLRDR